MKNYKIEFALFVLLVFVFVGRAHALTVDPSSTVPTDGSVLFNFQTQNPDITLGPNSIAGVGSEPLPLLAINNPSISITSATAATGGSVGMSGFVAGTGDAVPWLDGPIGNPARPAGLGVCQDTKDGCGGASTDNIEAGESILLDVNTPIFVGDIYFRDGNHELSFAAGAQFAVSIDGGAFMSFLFSAVDAAGVFSGLATTLVTSSIAFANPGSVCATARGGETCDFGEEYDFYIGGFGAEVPIPAALPLFLSGLIGFAFYSRKSV